MEKTKVLTPKEYAVNGGIVCPMCGDNNIEADSRPDVDAGCAWQNIHCLNCGASWNDDYDLVGYSRLKDVDEKEVPEPAEEPAREIQPGISLYLAGDIFGFLELLPVRMQQMFHADCSKIDFVREAKALQDRIWAAYGNQKPVCTDCNGTQAVPALAEENQDNGLVPCPTCSNVPEKFRELLATADVLRRYCTDEVYREEMDARAETATDGNVSALEAILRPFQLSPKA